MFGCGLGTIDNTRILYEVNFGGQSFIDRFSDHPRYYRGVVFQTEHRKAMPGEKKKKKLGYKTTPGNRDHYIRKGADLMEKKQIIVDQMNSKQDLSSLNQLQGFGKDRKGKYTGIGIHDDIAMTTLNLSRLWDIDEYQSFLYDLLDFGLSAQKKMMIQ